MAIPAGHPFEDAPLLLSPCWSSDMDGVTFIPMHLHGLELLVFAKDGWKLPLPYYCDTVNVAPGERYDLLVTCHTPGLWAFHCHILSHAESAHGMFGMVTVMVVEE